MTAYALQAAGAGTIGTLGIIAGTKQLRLAQVKSLNGNQYINIWRYSGAGLSGGSTVTPFPMRQGGPALSGVTAQVNATISGTGSLVYAEAAGTFKEYSPPFDLIIAPGSALFVVHASAPGGTTSAATMPTFMGIYCEALGLAYSF